MLAWFPSGQLCTRDVLLVLGWYVLAKVLERADAQVFALGGVVSGHTLKHIAAAAGAGWVLVALHRQLDSRFLRVAEEPGRTT